MSDWGLDAGNPRDRNIIKIICSDPDLKLTIALINRKRCQTQIHSNLVIFSSFRCSRKMLTTKSSNWRCLGLECHRGLPRHVCLPGIRANPDVRPSWHSLGSVGFKINKINPINEDASAGFRKIAALPKKKQYFLGMWTHKHVEFQG